MNKPTLLFLFVLTVFTCSLAQKKKITLEAIWKGEFRTESIDEIHSLNNGKQYAVLNTNPTIRSSSLDLYEYTSQKKVETLVTSSATLPYFTAYTFSKDESKLLLATAIEPLYRYSRRGIYYVYDIARKTLIQVSKAKIQEPLMSPDGAKVAYVLHNNLYVFDITSQTTKQVTTDGNKGTIINGITDWVYEEEFGFVRAFAWNPNSTQIAFLRFDETQVPRFSMDLYGQELYPYQYEFKYPKAGEANAQVSLHLLQVATGAITDVALPNAYYLPRIQWMDHSNHLSVQTLNRHQNQLKLYKVNTQDFSVALLLEENDSAYVALSGALTFLPGNRFLWTSERDGYNHLYLYNTKGTLLRQITQGTWEVTEVYGYDKKRDKLYYQSTEKNSRNRNVYSIALNGTQKQCLTPKAGTNAANFSADYTYFINTFSNATTPYTFTLRSASNGQVLKTLEDNKALSAKLEQYEISPKEFSTLRINGYDLNMWMIQPVDFDKTKKYPLLLFQYSGPGSQQVANRWRDSNDYWYQLLAAEGYIVACVDGRGTGFRGRDFKKVTQNALGKYEVEDQIAAAQQLSALPYIDAKRTGIWGWSYGGFVATNALLKGNDVFEMAIAVAPVTSWRFYDTIYTERFMRTPQENPGGYEDNAPLNYPELLQGQYLLIHGSGDDNVHVQHTMRMADALIRANKPFDWAIYPDRNHGIYGGNTRLHLYTKMTQFIKENL